MNFFNPNTGSTFAKGIVFALLLSFVLTGCRSVTDIPIEMKVSTSSLQFSPDGGDQYFHIESNTNRWTIINDAPSWLTIKPEAGQGDDEIQVIAAPNTSTTQKTAVITINGTGIESKTIRVTQEGVVPFLTVSASSFSFQANADEQSFTISSNTNWSITGSEAAWLTVSLSSGSGNASITLKAAANTNLKERSARLTVSGTGVPSREINATQAAGTPVRLDESWRLLIKAAMSSVPSQTLTNGTYKGQLSNGNRNGLGAYFWKEDEDIYFGGWNISRHGYGIYIVGNFDNAYLSNCPDCRIYAGNWADNSKSGTGSCYNKNGSRIYQGNFAENKPSGTYPGAESNEYRFDVIKSGGNYYIGETYNGKRNGYGIFLWQNGDMWYGSWSNDTGNGNGVYLYKNGNVITGTWKE